MGSNGPFDDDDTSAQASQQPDPAAPSPAASGRDVPADAPAGTAGAAAADGGQDGPGDDDDAAGLFTTKSTGSGMGKGKAMLDRAKTRALQNPKKTWTVVGVVGGVLLLGFIGIGVFIETTKKAPKRVETDLTGKLKVAEETARRLENWMDRLEAEKVALNTAMDAVRQENRSGREAIDKLLRRIEESEKTAKDRNAEFERRFADLKRGGSDFVFVGGENTGAKAGDASFEKAFGTLVATLTEERKRGGLRLAEARVRATAFAKEQGYAGEQALNVRDRVIDKVGILQVGHVQEPPMTKEEVESLLPELRPLAEKVRAHQHNLGAFEGKVIPRPEDVKRLVDSEVGPEKAKGIPAAAIERLAVVTRVRMANVPEALEEKLPQLAAAREQQQLKPNDIHGIEQLVWARRAELGGMTPGQHVALVWALARGDRAQGSAEIKPAASPASEEDIDFLRYVGERAVQAGIDLGVKSQNELVQRARTAIDRALEAQRKTLDDADRGRLAMSALVKVLAKASAQQAQPQPAAAAARPAGAGGTPQPGATAQQAEPKREERVIHLGQLTMREANAGRCAWMLVPHVVRKLGVDPGSVDGATTTAALWAAAEQVGKDAFAAAVEQPQAAKAWTDLVLERFTTVAIGAPRLVRVPTKAQGLPAELVELVSGVFYGITLGPYAENREKTEGAFKIAVDRIKRGPLLTAAQIAALQAIPATQPWRRVAAIVEDVQPQALPYDSERIQAIQDLLPTWMEDRQVAVAQIAQHARLGAAMRGKLAKEVGESLYTVMPMVLGQVDDGRSDTGMLKGVFKDEATLFATLAVAQAHLLDVGVTRVVLPYVNAMDANTGGVARLVQRLQGWLPEAVFERYKARRPQLTDSSFIDVAVSLAEELLPAAEREMVREVLLARVEPRLARAARDLDPEGLKDALRAVRAAAGDVAGAGPWGTNELDRLTIQLQRVGMDVLRARAPQAQAPGAKGQQGQDPRRPVGRAFPEVVEVKAGKLVGPPLGSRLSVADADPVRVIPGFSFAEATLMIGQALEIKGTGNSPVMLECDPKWSGPGGSSVTMPRLRVGGRAKANVGASRITVELTKLVYTFPNGRTIEKDITGFVVDSLEGKLGMLGEWHSNWQKVLPPALAAASLGGMGQALEQGNQTVEVNSGGTTIVNTNTGSTLERAAVGGLSEGAKLIEDYFRQFMDAVQPTVEAPNGQPMTVVLFTTVAFEDVTGAEWTMAMNPPSAAGF